MSPNNQNKINESNSYQKSIHTIERYKDLILSSDIGTEYVLHVNSLICVYKEGVLKKAQSLPLSRTSNFVEYWGRIIKVDKNLEGKPVYQVQKLNSLQNDTQSNQDDIISQTNVSSDSDLTEVEELNDSTNSIATIASTTTTTSTNAINNNISKNTITVWTVLDQVIQEEFYDLWCQIGVSQQPQLCVPSIIIQNGKLFNKNKIVYCESQIRYCIDPETLMFSPVKPQQNINNLYTFDSLLLNENSILSQQQLDKGKILYNPLCQGNHPNSIRYKKRQFHCIYDTKRQLLSQEILWQNYNFKKDYIDILYNKYKNEINKYNTILLPNDIISKNLIVYVYWEDDKEFYKGIIKLQNIEKGEILIQYENNITEWVDGINRKFSFIDDNEKQNIFHTIYQQKGSEYIRKRCCIDSITYPNDSLDIQNDIPYMLRQIDMQKGTANTTILNSQQGFDTMIQEHKDMSHFNLEPEPEILDYDYLDELIEQYSYNKPNISKDLVQKQVNDIRKRALRIRKRKEICWECGLSTVELHPTDTPYYYAIFKDGVSQAVEQVCVI